MRVCEKERGRERSGVEGSTNCLNSHTLRSLAAHLDCPLTSAFLGTEGAKKVLKTKGPTSGHLSCFQ